MSSDTRHLIPLHDGWSAWRWIVLRSAGFPAATVLGFAATATTAAIARLLELESEVALAREAAILDCRRAIADAADVDRKRLHKLLKRLRSDHHPIEGDGAMIAALRTACEHRDAQRRAVAEGFTPETHRISEAVRQLAGDPRFREAIVWQNRITIQNALDPLINTPVDPDDSHTRWVRRKEGVAINYAQRYCVKNDSIGFFGPIGWAHASDDDTVVRIRPGATLLDFRHVFFEYWCIDTLAAKLAADPELRPDLAPRLMPTVRVEGTTLHHPINQSTQLDPEYVAILTACDGRTPAREIARRVAAETALGVTAADVHDMLAELVELRVITWAIEIPTAGLHPERHLRQALDRLPAGDARERGLHALAELEARRAAVAHAAGDPVALDHALRALEEQFSMLTDAAATRRAGQTYAARTLVYEDTRRNVDVVLGARFMARIGPPLALLVQSARWYTHAITRAYRPVIRQVYDQLRERTGTAAVDYLQYLDGIVPHFARQQFDMAPTVRPVVDELHARWLDLLGVTQPEVRRIDLQTAALRARVHAVFAAPHPGWPEARYHSPDVMVAAAGPEAFARGELACVVNEIHVGNHTFARPLFIEMHPDPDALIRARDLDLGRPLVKPVEVRANVLRTGHFPPVPDDIDLETSDSVSWRRPERVIPIAQLVVEDVAGRLVVHTRDGSRTFDIIEVLEMYLQLASTTHFSILPPLAHTPRIAIDDLIVTRERWRFAQADLAFANDTGLDQFIGARRWATRHALPRFVFVRVATEPKPCFVDLASPLYVEMLARFIKQAPTLDVAEMLPAVDQTWLVDAEDRRYSSELRIAVVDPEHWRPE